MIVNSRTSKNLHRIFLLSKRNIANNTKNADSISIVANNQLDYLKTKIFEAMSVYEEAIGLKEIKDAQQSVLDVNYYKTFF